MSEKKQISKEDEKLLDIYIRSIESIQKMYASVAPYILEKESERSHGLTEADIINFQRKQEEYAKDKHIRMM